MEKYSLWSEILRRKSYWQKEDVKGQIQEVWRQINRDNIIQFEEERKKLMNKIVNGLETGDILLPKKLWPFLLIEMTRWMRELNK